MTESIIKSADYKKQSKSKQFINKIPLDFKRNKSLYLMFFPILVFFIIFAYIPMNGIIMAFQEFSPALGMFRSPWVGFEHFISFFSSEYIYRTLRNTVLLSVYSLIYGFPAPIILAILLNEVRSKVFKKFVQTVTYIPNFISMTIICGILFLMLKPSGVINYIIGWFGVEPINFLVLPEWFRTIVISSDIWTGVGFATIIYLAALASIDTGIYEAAIIDGAGRWKQLTNITLPGITPTIAILLIFSLGGLLNVGTEKILLLYNPLTYETADVIGTFIYRKGILQASYSFASAIGLFNTVVNFLLLILVNKIAKKVSDYSIW